MDASLKIFLHKIPEGYRGTLQTVEHISGLIRQGAKDFHVRQTAIDILLQRAVKPKDYLGEIKALFEWVQRHVRYSKDPYGVEVLHSANRMLELRAGDCDDMAILLGAMLEAVGHPVRLVLAGPDLLRQDLFTHIYLEVFHKGRWIPLDATMPYAMGWGPRAMVKKIIAIERRSNMMNGDLEPQGIDGVGAVPDWLRGLIRAVRAEAIQPRDARVKYLWNLLRQRQLLRQNQWLKAVLLRVWHRGLSARPRPRTTSRIKRSLRLWGILPPASVNAPVNYPAITRPITRAAFRAVRPVALNRVASVRAAAMQPIRPVQMRPAGIRAVGR